MRKQLLGTGFALLFVFVQLGCAGLMGGAIGGGKKNLEEAKALNASMEEGHQSTMSLFNDLQAKVEQVGTIPEDVDTSKFDMGKLKAALVAAYEAPVDKAKASKKAVLMLYPGKAGADAGKAVDAALAAPSEAEKALDEYLKTASPEAQKFMKAQLALVVELRDGLLGILPAQVEAVTKQVAEAKLKMEQFEKTAEAATKLPTAGKETKEQLKAVQTEKKKSEDLTSRILAEFKELPDRFGESAKKVVTSLASIGEAAPASEAAEGEATEGDTE